MPSVENSHIPSYVRQLGCTSHISNKSHSSSGLACPAKPFSTTVYNYNKIIPIPRHEERLSCPFLPVPQNKVRCVQAGREPTLRARAGEWQPHPCTRGQPDQHKDDSITSWCQQRFPLIVLQLFHIKINCTDFKESVHRIIMIPFLIVNLVWNYLGHK